MDPPEEPEAMVNRGSAYCLMKCSFSIDVVSAETTSSSPVPYVLRVPKATANPRRSGPSESAEVTLLLPERKAGPAPGPYGYVSLPFHPGPGFLPPADHGLEIGFVGSSRIAI